MKIQGEEVFADPNLPDNVSTVLVANGGSRYGVVPVPEAVIFDRSIRYGDVGVLAYLSATSREVNMRQFMIGVPLRYKFDCLDRLRQAGYITVGMDNEDGRMTIMLREVVAYKDKSNLVEIEIKKPKPSVLANGPRYEAYDPKNYCPEGVNEDLWNEFIKFRRDHKFSVKKAHVMRMKERLDGWGGDAESIIINSMDNCWQGLFPLKDGMKGSKSTQILTDVDEQDYEDEV